MARATCSRRPVRLPPGTALKMWAGDRARSHSEGPGWRGESFTALLVLVGLAALVIGRPDAGRSLLLPVA